MNKMFDMLAELGADIVHLGNAVNLKNALQALSGDTVVMGNIDPVLFRTASPDDIKADVQRAFDECAEYDNFMISTGCDVPAAAKSENINAYFEKITELYGS